tara:strand:+ start:331 stop:753 length:423 start_codon:yes stop_codon:yes gene_type:complete
MKINLPYFFLYVFCIGFVADIILLVLSKVKLSFKTSFNALKPYFDHYHYYSPVLAGITCVIGGGLAVSLFYVIGIKNEGFFALLLFITGMILDYIINITDVFKPWLNDYYNTATTLGSSIYGGFANIITGIPSYYLANIS